MTTHEIRLSGFFVIARVGTRGSDARRRMRRLLFFRCGFHTKHKIVHRPRL